MHAKVMLFLSLLSSTGVLLESHLVGDLALLLLFDAVALVFFGSLFGLDPARSGCVGQVDVHGGVWMVEKKKEKKAC
jgi:hypothetical protein